MLKKVFCSLLLLKVLFGSVNVAQELTLFEETESNINRSDEPVSVPNRRDREGNLITGPEFTLIGTMRIGESYTVVVKDRFGEPLSVSMPEDSSVSITGYPGFEIIGISAGNASVRYPENVNCIEFVEEGVTCESSNVATLSLKNGSPLEPRVVDIASSNNQSLGGSTTEEPVNPFEALLEGSSNPDAGSDADNAFTPRRISPEDVPPGMRVVSTPFGDRLVED